MIFTVHVVAVYKYLKLDEMPIAHYWDLHWES